MKTENIEKLMKNMPRQAIEDKLEELLEKERSGFEDTIRVVTFYVTQYKLNHSDLKEDRYYIDDYCKRYLNLRHERKKWCLEMKN